MTSGIRASDGLLTSHWLDDLRADAEATLWDKCILQNCSTTRDSLGQPVRTYVDSASKQCGFEYRFKNSGDSNQSFGQVAQVDAVIRLSLDETLHKDDRVLITHRQGVALVDQETYEVVGIPRRGLSLLVAELKRYS